ncbi:MAG: molybdopterin-dependent oxidoreductase [Smithella sp.]
MSIKKKKIYDPGYMTYELFVSGLVKNSLHLRVEDLQRMEISEVRNLTMLCGSGQEKGIVESYRGVLLRNILDKAEIILKEHYSTNWICIALKSSEGYRVIFSWHEIYNTAVGDQAIVIFEKNGEPLDEKEGAIAFISAGDYRPGPRRMRYLQRIEVHEIAGTDE